MLQPEPLSIRPQRSVHVDGDRLRELRLRSQLTQEELAAIVGYSDRLVRKLESGGPIQYRTLTDFISYFRDFLQLEIQDHVFLRPALHTSEARALAQLMAQWVDGILNQRDLSIVEELVHPDLKLHVDGKVLHGRQALRKRLLSLYTALVRCRMTIEHLVVDSTCACVYWKACSTRRCDLMGVTAGGRTVQIAGNMLVVFSQGLIIEIRDQWELVDIVDD